jgi:ABC-2 type transport system permease protein
MIDFSSLKNIKYNFEPLNYLNPMLWFGAPFEIIFNGGRQVYLYVFTVLLIVVPLICFYFYIKLSKKMESLLLKLEGEGKEKPSKHAIEMMIGKLLIRDETVKQAFHFTKAVLRSDRNLKLKIYPALSTGVLLPILMIFNMGMRGVNYEASGYEYLYLYFNFLVFTVVELAQYSSAWKGYYVFITSGFNNTRGMYKGVLQAIAVTLLIPLIIFNGAIYIILFRGKFLIDIVILLLSCIVVLPIIGKIYLTNLPFSKPIDESNQRQSIDKFFMLLGVTLCFVAIHFISYIIPMGTWIYIVLLFIGIPISWKFVIPQKNSV